jgi:diguanylate cyclase (GGDEF)-like protein
MNHSDTHTDLGPYIEDFEATGSWKRHVPKVLLTEIPDFVTARTWCREVALPIVRTWFSAAGFSSLGKWCSEVLLVSLRSRALRSCRSIGAFFYERSLTSELLLLQLVVSIVIGSVAVGAFWFTSHKSIDDNMRNWGEQWLGSLDEIGMPLYISGEADSYQGVEEYVKNFPEIAFVRFYDDTGVMIFEDVRTELLEPVPELTATSLTGLMENANGDGRHFFEQVDEEGLMMRVAKPIWTEALMADGLLGLDMNSSAAVEETLVGFVALGLDTTRYREELSEMLGMGLRWGLLLLLLLCGASWFIYRHALRPLLDLQVPLKRLAQGQTDFKVETSGHIEIKAIADALNTTLGALSEREEKLFFLANHDPLTGLVNRHKFMERLEHEVGRLNSEGTHGALLFIDLDHFKYLNDTAGHAAGDILLKDVADHLLTCVRKYDTVGRFGGDEFVILLSDISEEETQRVCEKLLHKTGEHKFEENGETFIVRCSIGATYICNKDYASTDLMTQADMACHKAKSSGRNRYEVYKSSSESMIGMAREISLSQEIKEALQNDSFVLQFQPIVSVADGQYLHYETLIRMPMEDRKGRKKLLLPDAFIPAAIRFDLMVDIDRWVMRNAIQMLAAARITKPNTVFTLNVSANMIESQNFLEFFESVLGENNVPMSAIVLEITEQVALRTLGASGALITTLAEKGCQLALDNFGAGFSAYSYLKSLPVTFIKIDGSLIKNIANDVVDQKVVASLVEIAHAMGKQTVAEHVVDEATFNILGDLGVDYAQGNYVGKPNSKLI